MGTQSVCDNRTSCWENIRTSQCRSYSCRDKSESKLWLLRSVSVDVIVSEGSQWRHYVVEGQSVWFFESVSDDAKVWAFVKVDIVYGF